MLRPGQLQVFPQDLEQRLVRRESDLDRLPVDGKSDGGASGKKGIGRHGESDCNSFPAGEKGTVN